MSRFLQLHLLTFYPPSNLNRDDSGAPKTAMIGGSRRLRISSQCLKRSWRTSDIFQNRLKGLLGERTQRIGQAVYEYLLTENIEDKKAKKIGEEIAESYGKLKKDKEVIQTEQLVFISPEEKENAFKVAKEIAEKDLDKKDKELLKKKLLKRADTAIDIGLFGRMLSDSPSYNREAAAQVSHAITTHSIIMEDDFFTAVDDLKNTAEDAGAAHIGETEFGSGVFYIYACINYDLLLKNLGEDIEKSVVHNALSALIEATATVSPSGKQNSFAALARAGYILVEKGQQQPRSLAGAFAKPIDGTDDIMGQSIKKLKEFKEELNVVYGVASDQEKQLELGSPKSATLKDISNFCQEW